MGELGVAAKAFVILLFVASGSGPCKDARFIYLDQVLMGLSPMGFFCLVLTQTAESHGYLFPLLGCIAVNARRSGVDYIFILHVSTSLRYEDLDRP
jgi:hypothetical protein